MALCRCQHACFHFLLCLLSRACAFIYIVRRFAMRPNGMALGTNILNLMTSLPPFCMANQCPYAAIFGFRQSLSCGNLLKKRMHPRLVPPHVIVCNVQKGCTAYAVHVSGICRTRVRLMPYTCLPYARHP